MKGDDPRPGEGKGPNDHSTTQDTNRTLEAALIYVGFGMAVVPLHGITKDGNCTCPQGINCPSAGKHPKTPNGVHNATLDPAVVSQWWAKWPDANVAIATGAISNLVVIDIDMHDDGEGNPVDGEASLQALIEELGPLPPTVESLSGGGGRHLLFRHPGGTVRNSSSKLGPGVDVKADGGCVVAAPSKHQDGPLYQWEASSLPGEIEIAELPEAWLEAITRPAETAERRSGGATGSDAPLDKARIVSGLAQGERDQMIFLEVRSMRGRGFDRSEAEVIIREIAARCDPPFPESEALAKVDRVWKQHPPNGDGYGAINQELESARKVVMAAFPQIEKDIDFAHMQAILERIGIVAHLDPIRFEGLMSRLKEVHGDQAVAGLRTTVKATAPKIANGLAGSPFSIVFGDDIETLPAPEWQVENILVKGSLAFLFGKPGVGKSIAALDIAGSVAAGIDWHGHAVIPGRAVYVIAEGLGDFGLRVQAFRLARSLDSLPDVAYLLEPLHLFSGDGFDADRFADALTDWDPSLVVIDTLARCITGGDENSARDMGIVIAAADRLRHQLDATVLIVAHTGKDGKLLRGSSALEGATDTAIKAETKSGNLVLKCEKQKMAARFPDLTFRLDPTEKSVVLVPTGIGTKLTDIQTLGAGLVPPEGITHGDWKKRFVEAGGKEGSFRHVLENLDSKGIVEKGSEGKGALYFLTQKGRKHA